MLAPNCSGVGWNVFASLMVFCAFVDIDTMTLPDFATVGGTVLGFLISILLPGLHGIDVGGAPYFVSMVASAVSSAVGIAVGSGIVYWIRLLGECVFGREAMGEGDVILAGCIGAFCGWQGAVFAIFGGSVIGAVLLLPVLAIAKVFGPKKPAKREKAQMLKTKVIRWLFRLDHGLLWGRFYITFFFLIL